MIIKANGKVCPLFKVAGFGAEPQGFIFKKGGAECQVMTEGLHVVILTLRRVESRHRRRKESGHPHEKTDPVSAYGFCALLSPG